MTEREPLAVWLYGTQVAVLSEGRGIEWTWTDQAYERWGGNSRVVSNLLPITGPRGNAHPARVAVFLAGLLPEGNARLNYAMDAGLISDDTYGLISRYGRDTAGALVFQPVDEPEPVRVGHYEPLTDIEAGRRLLDLAKHSPPDPPLRGVESISLAGLQPKIGLHRDGSGWQACKAGAPSTWIVKLAHPDDSQAADVVDTEVLSIDLARAVGLTNITAEIVNLGGVRALAVSRYDRIETDAGVGRVHQEDLAQALGINTSDPVRKFQRGSPTPSFALAAQVLRVGGSEPDQLLALVVFNHLIGNTDFHAKNISFLRHDDGTATLAPAYDVAMHLHHTGGNQLSAIDVNGKYRMRDIKVDDLLAEGVSWGLPARRARSIVTATVEKLNGALQLVEVDRYPNVSDIAIDAVRDGLDDAALVLGCGLITSAETASPSAPDRVSDKHGEPHQRDGVSTTRRRGPRKRRS